MWVAVMVEPGDRLEYVAAQLVHIAATLRVEAVATFNNTQISAEPTEAVGEVLTRYYRDRKE